MSAFALAAVAACGACQGGAKASTANTGDTSIATSDGAADAAAAPSGAATSGRMKTISIDDPSLGMSAVTLSIPAEWRSQGTILHQDCDLTPITVLRANSADGSTGVQIFPRFDTVSGNAGSPSPACRMQPPQSPADFARTTLIPMARPGAQVVSVTDIPGDKTAEQVSAANAHAAQSIQQNMARQMPARFTGESKRIRIRYPAGGRTIEEDLDVTVVSQDLPLPHPTMFGDPSVIHMIKTQTTVVGTRAPAGSLVAIEPVSAAIGASSKMNPQWYQRALAQAQQILAGRDQRNAQQARAMVQQTEDNIHAVGNASMAAAARSEAARHAGAQAFAEHMGDHQTVMDPATGRTAQVSNQYNHTYYDPRTGRAIQTNSASNPGTDWTELQVVPAR